MRRVILKVMLRRAGMFIKKEALAIVTIILLAFYILVSCKTYFVERKRYEVICSTYEATRLIYERTLYLNEMIRLEIQELQIKNQK